MGLGEILRLAAQRAPGKPAVVGDGLSVTFAEYDRLANRFAHFLISNGVGRGDRVACILFNGLEYGIVHFGNARAGSVLVHISPMHAVPEIARIIERTRPRVVVTDRMHAEAVAGIAAGADSVAAVAVVGDPPAGGGTGLEDALAGQPEDAPRVAIDPSDPVAMTFTGGTTGEPKGAVVSHAARHVSAWTTALEHRVTGEDVTGVVTPMFHAVGLMIWYQATVLAGCTSVIFRRWNAGEFIAEVERYGISSVFLVPVQVRDLLDSPDFDPRRLASLANVGVGGAPTPAGLIAECSSALPHCDYTDHYGQSETGPLTILKPWQAEAHPGSIGQAAAGVDLRIVDGDGAPVAPGEIGELIARGPFLMDGYFEDSAETERYFRKGDGWGWSGDLAVMDEAGFVTLVGRSKEMIISGGINIYPREVELVLEARADIADCVVFGVPDERWGEALVAHVVRAPGTDVSKEDLGRYCAEQMARYKRPREIVFVDNIPKTPSGKVQKPLLREAHLKDLRRMADA